MASTFEHGPKIQTALTPTGRRTRRCDFYTETGIFDVEVLENARMQGFQERIAALGSRRGGGQ